MFSQVYPSKMQFYRHSKSNIEQFHAVSFSGTVMVKLIQINLHNHAKFLL